MNRAVSKDDGRQYEQFPFGEGTLYLSAGSAESGGCSFRSPCGNNFLLFEGELTNRYELKNKLLGKGAQFNTDSDAEVLLWALMEWGKEIVKELEGMFAFVFLNTEKREILSARDRQGIKPLYCHLEEDVSIISSSIRAIFASGIPAQTLNTGSIRQFLSQGFIEAPKTFYQSIQELKAGTCNIMNAESHKLDEALFCLAEGGEEFGGMSDGKLVEQFEELLSDALFRNFPHGQYFGMSLDGTLNGALLLTLGKKVGALPTYIFTQNFSKKQEELAEELLAFLGISHHPIRFNREMLSNFGEYVDAMEQPMADPETFIRYLTAKICSPYAKVLWSTEGSRELLGTKSRIFAFYQYLSNYENVQKLLPVLRQGSGWLPAKFNSLAGGKIDLLKKYVHKISPGPSETFQAFVSDSVLAEPFPVETPLFENEPGSPDFVSHNLSCLLQFEQHRFLSRAILPSHELIFRQWNLETRLPFQDEALVDFIHQLPAGQLLEKGRNWMVEALLEENKLGKLVKKLARPTSPPIGKWIREMWADEAKSLYLETNALSSYLDLEQVECAVKLHLEGKEDRSSLIWRLLVLKRWLERNS